METLDLLLQIAALAVSAVTAWAVDHLTDRRGLTPPGFREPWRRGLAAALLATLFWLGIFGPAAAIGRAEPPDPAQLQVSGLFLLHALMVLVILAWYALGWLGLPEEGEAGREGGGLAAQLGLLTPRPGEEVALGALAGIAGWMGVLVVMMVAVGLYSLVAGEESLPRQAPQLVAWIAGLPIPVKVAVSLSAGLVEEAFFRGLLQPRVGIGLSTFLFVLAHASYEQPFMLVGLTLLSLLMAYLVRWRQTIWPAVVAHALFDLVQLVVIIPTVLRFVPVEGG